jgi:NAD(P)H-hydrate epimerase
LKGAATIITDGTHTAVNVAGTPAQAKAGSGDVLSGLCAGLCATGLSSFEGGMAGAYLAGTAAQIASKTTGEYSLTASDEISSIGAAFLSLRD